MFELASDTYCPGEPCYQIEALGRTTGTTGNIINPRQDVKKLPPLKMYRLKFTMASTITYIDPSIWYAKGVYSMQACKFQAESSINTFMTGPESHKNAEIASMSYRCEEAPQDA